MVRVERGDEPLDVAAVAACALPLAARATTAHFAAASAATEARFDALALPDGASNLESDAAAAYAPPSLDDVWAPATPRAAPPDLRALRFGGAAPRLRPQPAPTPPPPDLLELLAPPARAPRRAAAPALALDEPMLPAPPGADAPAPLAALLAATRAGAAPARPPVPERATAAAATRPRRRALPPGAAAPDAGAALLRLMRRGPRAHPAWGVPDLDAPALPPALLPGLAATARATGWEFVLSAPAAEVNAAAARPVRPADGAPPPWAPRRLAGPAAPAPARARVPFPPPPPPAPPAPLAAALAPLEAPMLPAALAATGGLGALLAGALRPRAPLPEAWAADVWALPPGAWPTTIEDLVLQEMLPPGDGALTLPVPEPAELPRWPADAAAGPLRGALEALGVRAVPLAGAALYLDWSLSRRRPALRPPALAALVAASRARLAPARRPAPPADGGAVRARSEAVLRRLAPRCGAAAPPPPGERAASAAELAAAAAAAEAAPEESAARARAAPPPAPPRRDGLAFFMALQPGAPAPADSGATSGGGPARLPSPPRAPRRAVVRVALPVAHLELLRGLAADDAAQLAAAPPGALPPAVAASAFPSLDAVRAALVAPRAPGAGRAAARALAAAAALRQAAGLLAHHGARAAALYLAAAAAELPGALGAGPGARALAAAAAEAEAGAAADSPKHAALRRALAVVATLQPGARVLVAGDPKGFFALYPVVAAAGLRPAHLDRGGELLAAGAPRGETRAAAAAADADADCVLVDGRLAAAPGFTLAAFQHVVAFATEPGAQAPLRAALVAAGVSATLLELEPFELEAPAAPPLPLLASAPAAPAAAQAAAAGAGRGGTACPSDWPLVLSTDPARPAAARRALREALLSLERAGAAAAERPLPDADACLSPAAALVVHAAAPRDTLEAVAAALAPALARLARAYSKVHLVLEAPASALRAAAAGGAPRLQAAAAAAGLAALDVEVAATPEEAARAARAVCAAHLAAWRAAPGGYEVADAPPPLEAFLAAFPSLNPHSAAALAATGLPPRALLALGAVPAAGALPRVAAGVPGHCLALLAATAAAGAPLAGFAPEAAAPEQAAWAEGEAEVEPARDWRAGGGGAAGWQAPPPHYHRHEPPLQARTPPDLVQFAYQAAPPPQEPAWHKPQAWRPAPPPEEEERGDAFPEVDFRLPALGGAEEAAASGGDFAGYDDGGGYYAPEPERAPARGATKRPAPTHAARDGLYAAYGPQPAASRRRRLDEFGVPLSPTLSGLEGDEGGSVAPAGWAGGFEHRQQRGYEPQRYEQRYEQPHDGYGGAVEEEGDPIQAFLAARAAGAFAPPRSRAPQPAASGWHSGGGGGSGGGGSLSGWRPPGAALTGAAAWAAAARAPAPPAAPVGAYTQRKWRAAGGGAGRRRGAKFTARTLRQW
jgi:hypothetical protein